MTMVSDRACPNRIQMPRDDCHLLEKCLTREWLETNGLDGYASSTPLMCPTRRYHGLLVVPPDGHVKRHVFLSRYEEELAGGDKSFPLSMARYPDLWSPLGHNGIESFELAPYPSALYRFGSVEMRREIQMVRGEPTVLCRYTLSGCDGTLELRLRPLLPYREADELTFENIALNTRVDRIDNGFVAQPYDVLPAIAITVDGEDCRFEADPVWYRQLEYSVDIDRGYAGREDQFSPGVLHIPVSDGSEIVVAATIGAPVSNPVQLWEGERLRREADPRFEAAEPRSWHDLAADDFLYRAPTGRLGVVAGWPWFGEWGRDTYISLPGLTLARGQVDDCAEALTKAVDYLDRGLLPNIFGAGREDSHYGSVDASLWYARAVRLFEAAGGSQELVLDVLRPALIEIARSYRDGTKLAITCEDGLIEAGSEDLNATWMDARTSAGPVTPRHGFAVEINALWYSLIAHLVKLADAAGDEASKAEWMQLEQLCRRRFLEVFWLDDAKYLADCWRDGAPDPSVRPNMVLAAALELSPLSRSQRTYVVERAEVDLLTPRGLRTLSPESEDYEGQYRGGTEERDHAYHQGTVWPWLLGFYCEAYLRAHGRDERTTGYVRQLLDGFTDHLSSYGLGHVSEVFGGDPPHRPGGTIAQAWSTAEILRAYALIDGAVA